MLPPPNEPPRLPLPNEPPRLPPNDELRDGALKERVDGATERLGALYERLGALYERLPDPKELPELERLGANRLLGSSDVPRVVISERELGPKPRFAPNVLEPGRVTVARVLLCLRSIIGALPASPRCIPKPLLVWLPNERLL